MITDREVELACLLLPHVRCAVTISNGKSDILWRDASTGDTAIWFMNGASIASTRSFGAVPAAWTIQQAN